MKTSRFFAISWAFALTLLVPLTVQAQADPPRAPLATLDYDAGAPLDVREDVFSVWVF